MEAIASDPQRVAEGVGLALTTLRPRRHRRIGYDATMLRLASDAVPDAVLDRATRAVTRLGRAS
jgi:hypothetical protein